MTIIIKSAQSSIKRDQRALESMDLFLKFMAKQGIQIEYKNSKTAYYNLETNVITLPNYVLNDIDMFIRFGTHEAAHSLFTPNFFYSEHNKKSDKTPNGDSGRSIVIDGKNYKLSSALFSCINIVEDIRIEKLIRQHFPGLIAPYRRSAKALSETKEWSFLKKVKDNQAKFDSLSLADKINLKTKFKEYLTGVDLTDKEYAILKYVSNTKSFEDVLLKALFLFNLKDKNVNNMRSKEIQDFIDKINEKLSDGNIEDGSMSDFEELDNLDGIDKQEILDNRVNDKDEVKSSAPGNDGNVSDDLLSDIMDMLEDASVESQNAPGESDTNSDIITDEFSQTNDAFDRRNERDDGKFARQQLLDYAHHKKHIKKSFV